MPPLDFVLGGERPAQGGCYPEHREEVPRDPIGPRIRWFAALALEPERRAGDRRQPVERLLHLPPVAVHLRGRKPGAEHLLAGRVVLEDDGQPVVLVEGKSTQDHRIDHREDRRGGADAEREHRQGDGGEGGGRAKRSEGCPEVVEHGGLDGR